MGTYSLCHWHQEQCHNQHNSRAPIYQTLQPLPLVIFAFLQLLLPFALPSSFWRSLSALSFPPYLVFSLLSVLPPVSFLCLFFQDRKRLWTGKHTKSWHPLWSFALCSFWSRNVLHQVLGYNPKFRTNHTVILRRALLRRRRLLPGEGVTKEEGRLLPWGGITE